jgi:hypothetical protein
MECIICCEVAEPFIMQCKHSVCYKCYHKLESCPFCRKKHLFFTDVQIQNDRQDIHINNTVINIQEIPVTAYGRRFNFLALLSCCCFLCIGWMPPVLYYQVQQTYLKNYFNNTTTTNNNNTNNNNTNY